MKTQINFFIIMMMIAFSLSLRTVKIPQPVQLSASPVKTEALLYYFDNYFLGEWNAVGYKCNNNTLAVQRVNVRQEKGRFYGIKLTGDQCVPANKLSPMCLSFGIGSPVIAASSMVVSPEIILPSSGIISPAFT